MGRYIYDSIIEDTFVLLSKYEKTQLRITNKKDWRDIGEHNMILRKDMAYELGGGSLPAISGLGITTSKRLIPENEILLYGPDLPQLTNDSPYARITMLRVVPEGLGEGDLAYASIRKLEYTRYHMHPEGYMMRISTTQNREPVRISKEALQQGLNFTKVGNQFLEAYQKYPKVEAAKIIFITFPDFPYAYLQELMEKAQQITESLNHIFQNLKMDCSVCNQKALCDEVEGMKELHFMQNK